MSANNLNNKSQAFHRLLHDLHQDAVHNATQDEHEHLPRMAQSASIAELKNRLRQRYRHRRITPTLMYMPRIALTACILLTCAVAYLYINKLRDLNNIDKQLKVNERQHLLDSLLHNRQKTDSIINNEKRY